MSSESDLQTSTKSNISVLVSVYRQNTSVEFNRCFESIKQQTLPADQVVLVVDGPVADEIEDLIVWWNSRLPLTIVRLQTNRGLAYALNAGLSACRNDYVARIDIDDYCFNERFAMQQRFLDLNIDVIVLGGQAKLFGETGPCGERVLPTSLASIRRFSLFRNPLSHSTVVFRRQPVQAIGGYPEARYGQDYLLWIACLSRGYQVRNLNQFVCGLYAGSDMLRRRSLVNLRYDLKPHLANYRYRRAGVLLTVLAVSLRTCYSLYCSVVSLVRFFPKRLRVHSK